MRKASLKTAITGCVVSGADIRADKDPSGKIYGWPTIMNGVSTNTFGQGRQAFGSGHSVDTLYYTSHCRVMVLCRNPT